MALKFIWLQYFLDQAVGPGEYFLDQVNISWARWLVLQEISLSIKRDFWIHISRSLATHRLPPSLARKSVRPNVISGGQLSKCGDLLEIEITIIRGSFLEQKLCSREIFLSQKRARARFHFRKALAGASFSWRSTHNSGSKKRDFFSF